MSVSRVKTGNGHKVLPWGGGGVQKLQFPMRILRNAVTLTVFGLVRFLASVSQLLRWL